MQKKNKSEAPGKKDSSSATKNLCKLQINFEGLSSSNYKNVIKNLCDDNRDLFDIRSEDIDMYVVCGEYG